MPLAFIRRFSNHLISLGVVLLVGFVAYSNTFNVPFQFDDFNVSNKSILLSRAYSVSSRQVADFSFLLNHFLHGNDVVGFHILNLLIHLCTAVTVYFTAYYSILALAGQCDDKSESDQSAFILQFVPVASALLFVCHPIQTQAVTYIVQRYTSLATLFYMLSTLMFIRARMHHLAGSGHIHVWIAGILSFFSGLLAMRCKEIAFTLPIMLVLVEAFIFHGRMLRSRIFLAGIFLLLLVIPAQQLFLRGNLDIDELFYNINRGTREELTYSRTDYLLTQFRVIVTYVRLMFLPINQNLDYDYPLLKNFFSLPVVMSVVFHIIMLSSALVLFFRSRLLFVKIKFTQGICLRLCSFGIVWFYVALMVESSFIPILDVIFEHRLYLPSFGFILAVVSAAALLFTRRETLRKILWIALAVICITLTIATIRRNVVWNDEVSLWEDTAAKSPDKKRVLNNLAAFYLSKKMPEKAIVPILKVLDREPGYTESLNNLGLLLDLIPKVKGRYSNGMEFFTPERNLDLKQLDPWYANTRNNLGLVYELVGDRVKALAYYEKAVAADPGIDAFWINLALLSARQGDKKRSAEAIDKLKELNPDLSRMVESDIRRFYR